MVINSKLLKFYTPGVGQYYSNEGLHLKNFEAKGRTDRKSKVYTIADVLFSPLKIGEEQKKDLHDRRSPFFH